MVGSLQLHFHIWFLCCSSEEFLFDCRFVCIGRGSHAICYLQVISNLITFEYFCITFNVIDSYSHTKKIATKIWHARELLSRQIAVKTKIEGKLHTVEIKCLFQPPRTVPQYCECVRYRFWFAFFLVVDKVQCWAKCVISHRCVGLDPLHGGVCRCDDTGPHTDRCDGDCLVKRSLGVV